MADPTPESRTLSIKRYPNRRFYDATRSRHVTLHDLYDLVTEGFTIHVTDSASGADITNVVLTQMILDRDAEKLAIFPSDILHAVIRTRQQFLGTVVEDFFRQTLSAQRAAQEQWAKLFQPPADVPDAAANPMEWTRAMMESFARAARPPAASGAAAEKAPPAPPAEDEIAALREQVAALSRKVEQLSGGRKRSRKSKRSE